MKDYANFTDKPTPPKDESTDDDTDGEEDDRALLQINSLCDVRLPRATGLEKLKAFIIQSKAFLKLRDDVRDFVYPRPRTNGPEAQHQPLVSASNSFCTSSALKTLLLLLYSKTISAAVLALYEPPLCMGFARVRWTCVSLLSSPTRQ